MNVYKTEKIRNIAILGTDARKGDDDSNARTDAIIVASINEETDEVKLFSVFRDTLLDVGDEGLDKITHAYVYGGAERSLYTLNKNLDLNIDEVVVINWKTVIASNIFHGATGSLSRRRMYLLLRVSSTLGGVMVDFVPPISIRSPGLIT